MQLEQAATNHFLEDTFLDEPAEKKNKKTEEKKKKQHEALGC